TAGSLERVFRTLKDRKATNSILAIIAHTQQTAPFLMEKVFGLVLQFVGVAELGKALVSALDQQIESERSAHGGGALRLERPPRIPEAFHAAYEPLFDEIFRILNDSILDKSRLAESLVDVFTDFLARWGPTFDQLREHHRAALREIAGRTIAEVNGGHQP